MGCGRLTNLIPVCCCQLLQQKIFHVNVHVSRWQTRGKDSSNGNDQILYSVIL